MRNLRNTKGFTLIELMIVVVIIGILAAIAIPKFSSVSKNAKEAEADPILKQAFSLQQSYQQKNDEFANDDAELMAVGWDTAQAGKYYSFSVDNGDADSFCVEATASDTAIARTKKIDETRVVQIGGC